MKKPHKSVHKWRSYQSKLSHEFIDPEHWSHWKFRIPRIPRTTHFTSINFNHPFISKESPSSPLGLNIPMDIQRASALSAKSTHLWRENFHIEWKLEYFINDDYYDFLWLRVFHFVPAPTKPIERMCTVLLSIVRILDEHRLSIHKKVSWEDDES